MDPSGVRVRIRRAIEFIAALFSLLIASPVMLLIAIAIRIDTRGPIFYSQIRLGYGGRRFRLYKFRKFEGWAEGSGRAVTLRNDPRMTRVGGILERFKLDELPQLWNIVLGDMVFVGPRPETEDFADCFTGSFRHVLDYTPGLFGPSQVAFRNEGAMFPEGRDPHEFYRSVLFPAKARLDLSYYPYRNLVSDIAWVIRGLLSLSAFRRSSSMAARMDLPLIHPKKP